MLRWFHALLPKEERFFELFAQHSRIVVAGAEALRGMLEGGDAVARHYPTVLDREHDADDVTREVLIAVRRSFITPFDRSDVKDLITSMDNAIDQMHKTAKTIMLFDQRAFTRQQREMAEAIVTAANLVQEAIPLLSSINQHAARISSLTEQLSKIEGRADELHDEGLRELYQANLPTNASLAFFVGVEIYDHLEKVVDRFDDVGNEIHGIMLENV
jgi:predicted phosphate transport protein (TIGR00153 family)